MNVLFNFCAPGRVMWKIILPALTNVPAPGIIDQFARGCTSQKRFSFSLSLFLDIFSSSTIFLNRLAVLFRRVAHLEPIWYNSWRGKKKKYVGPPSASFFRLLGTNAGSSEMDSAQLGSSTAARFPRAAAITAAGSEKRAINNFRSEMEG